MESFSNILFSSVVGGPSFVHSPHVPSPMKLNSCSYYLSILDPNMELPILSTKDIDELLPDTSFNKPNKEHNSGTFDNNFCKKIPKSARPSSLIVNSKQKVESNTDSNSKNLSVCDNSVALSSDDQLNSILCGILFKCIVKSCNKNFKNKAEQMNHFFTEHKDKTISCVSCKSIFKSKYSLQKHFLMNPDCKLKNTYRCTMEQCDKYFFNLRNLEIHLSEQHCVPSISCLSFSCCLKFFDIASRDDHVSNCHREILHQCVNCSKVLFDRDLLEKHDLKHNRDICSRNAGSVQMQSCHVDKYYSSISNTICNREFCHSNASKSLEDTSILRNNSTLSDLQRSKVIESVEIKVLYACPLPECSETLNDKVEFQSHFLKHFTGELPGDINSLLPPDPPVPGLELHSKTFEANVDYMYQREETNLVQALDLVPDKLLQSLEWLDDVNSSSLPNSCLTSALILPSTDATLNRNLSALNNRRRKTSYRDESSNNSNNNNNNIDGTKSTLDSVDSDANNGPKPKYKCGDSLNVSLSYSLLSSNGSCARTCPKVNSVMANLIKRRRVFLRERVGMMQSCHSVLYQPAARQPALKQVVHQIFNSQQLPNKYEEIVNVDCSEL